MPTSGGPGLWEAYRRAPLVDRLWVLVRRAVCPWDAVVDALPRAGRVLDVGCGRGLLAALLQRDLPTLSYVGVDVAEHGPRVAELCLRNGRAEFHLLTPERWEELGTFDCVVLVDVLYAVEAREWSRLLSRCAERLKGGGVLVLKETVATPRWKRWVALAQETLAVRVVGYTRGDPPHIESERAYLDALGAAGLVSVEHRRVDAGYPWPHYLFVAQAPDSARVDAEG